MTVDPQRISRDIEAIASFNETTPAIGYSRPTFSKSWAKARDYVIAEAEAAGCKSSIDAAGNVHIRPKKLDKNVVPWLSGSHIDSVPTGGKFDGAVGIVCALEVLRSAHADRKTLPLELIIFAEEEGTTFGYGMIGSRLWAGDATIESIRSFKNSAGETFAQAGRPFGVQPEKLPAERFKTFSYRGLIEIHIEQGPAMWETGVPVAIVTAISGRRQYLVDVKGISNHAGSAPMQYRSDALVAAAHMILDIEKMAGQLSPQAVATVGRIECEPNAINVVPGSVRFTIDLRSPHPTDLVDGHRRIEQMIRDSPVQDAHFSKTEDQPIVQMDEKLVSQLQHLMGPAAHTTISGALHDAAILAPHVPTAMIFIASKDGISHNPAEFSRIEDIATAAEQLAKLVSQ